MATLLRYATQISVTAAVFVSLTCAQPIANAIPFETCDQVLAAGAAPIRAGQPGYSLSLDSDGDGLACEGGSALASGTVGTLVQVVIHKSYAPMGDSCVGIGQLAAIQPGSQVSLSPGTFQGAMPEVGRTYLTHSDLKNGLCFVTYRATAMPMMPTVGLQFIAPDGSRSGIYGPTKTQFLTLPENPDIRQAVRVDMEFAP